MSLKQFEIISKLGSGSFGIVYKAKRKESNQICVIKEVEMKKMDRKMKEWAMNEAKIMKNINSVYIVKYFQSFIDKEKFYICMEYCSGGDLCQFLKGQIGKPLNEQIIWRFTIEIMLGLRDLHAKKILHRDIKTMNVFLSENKSIRIGDLGVAKNLTGDFASTIVGTPYYLSPEMCEEKPYNEKTDVWAMGCLVYQLCTYKHPFEANSQAALALKIVVGKYPPLPSQYSQTLSWLVRLCLSVDYKRRPTIDYLLQQQSIKDIATKLGISLNQQITIEKETLVKQKSLQQKAAEKKQQITTQKNSIPPKPSVIPKKNEFIKKQPADKKSVDRNKSKSIERSKIIPKKQIKKQSKPQLQQPQTNKFLPPKQKAVQQPLKKIQEKQRISRPALQNQRVQQKKQKPLSVFKPQKSEHAQEIKEKEVKQQKQALLIYAKPKKSVQQLVDDDQLFKDFGITPEKIVTMDQKVEFKKINTINWNIMQKQQKVGTQGELAQLPTIKTPSGCEIVAVECKQIDDQEVAEQLDDNIPYKSSDQDNVSDGDDTLLLEDLPQIQQDGQLKKKQNLLLLQKKIVENEKRKKQLVDLKKQYQAEILLKTNKTQYEKIKALMREDSDEDIEKVIIKELQGGNVLKFIKIYHFESQIERCDNNIEKWKEKAKQIALST